MNYVHMLVDGSYNGNAICKLIYMHYLLIKSSQLFLIKISPTASMSIGHTNNREKRIDFQMLTLRKLTTNVDIYRSKQFQTFVFLNDCSKS